MGAKYLQHLFDDVVCEWFLFPGETEKLEADCISALSAVHVVSEGEDDLEHALQPLAPLDLLRTLQLRLQNID